MLLLYCIAIVSVLLPGGYGLPGGPPIGGFRDRICDQLLPSHGSNTPRTGNGGYFILSNLINNGGAYTAGQSYSLQLLGTANTFRGFLIQARDGGENYIGSFTDLPALTQTLGCDTSNPAATVTHSNTGLTNIPALNFTWQAPSGSDGTVTFMYTVVQVFATFYTALDASQERPPSTVTPLVPTTMPTMPPPTPLNFNQPPAAPNVPPEDYRLTGRIPAGCTPTVDCSYFVGIQTNTNSSFLDIYLEGDAEGWVAVGITSSANMFSADVLGCNRMEQTDEVFVVDTWNPASPTRTNVLDPNQDGVFAYSSGFANGRISCNFSRFIGVVNPSRDLDLSRNYFLMFGRGAIGGRGGGMSRFETHRPQSNPTISASRVNLVTDAGEVGADTVRDGLIRAHGILMIIAWPILAMTAIFFASWMKPALPNGEWFQVHRAFLIASLFIAALAFLLIFVAFRQSAIPGLITLGSGNGTGTAHFVIGIIVMAIHIVNPIIAVFRCKPNDKNRWIFRLLHASLIGLIGQSLALTNVGLGLARFSTIYSRFGDLTIFWLFLAFIVFYLVLVGVLLIAFVFIPSFTGKKSECGTECAKEPPSGTTEIELTSKEKPAIDEPPPRKPPSKDAPFRWVLLGVFLAVLIPLWISIIVLVALPQ